MDTPRFKALYPIEKTPQNFTEFHALMEDGTLTRLRWTPSPGGLGKFEVFPVEIDDHRPTEETPRATYTSTKVPGAGRRL